MSEPSLTINKTFCFFLFKDLTTVQELSILGTYRIGDSTHSHHSEPSSASLGSMQRCRSLQKKMGNRWDYPCFEVGHLARWRGK